MAGDAVERFRAQVAHLDVEPAVQRFPQGTRTAADALGVDRLRRADADTVRAATGFAIGGTPPFGHPGPLRVVVDEDLLAHDVVWAAAGAPDAVFPIEPERLLALTGAPTARVAED